MTSPCTGGEPAGAACLVNATATNNNVVFGQPEELTALPDGYETDRELGLEWAYAGGEDETIEIDDNGRPFRTAKSFRSPPNELDVDAAAA